MKRLEGNCRFIVWTVMVFFYAPIVVLIANSFNSATFSSQWQGFSFKWYAALFRDTELWHALLNSLKAATASTAASVCLGTTAALALHKWRSRLQTLHYGLIYTHLVLPDILMGISLLLFFIAIGAELGLGTIIIAHTTFCISYVAMSVLGRLQDFDDSLVEAAKDLGANVWTTFWRVQLPLMKPGIIAGGLLAFTLSIDDFVITFFVTGDGSDTLPIQIYSMIKHSRRLPVINALSTVMLIFTATMVFSSRMIQRRAEKRG
jgi:ABC-type spermidine/putrescine transport system, permease component II